MDRTGLAFNNSFTRTDLPVEDWRSSLMEKKIDLYNFESVGARDCPYILTSPRSLRACARMKIQPVELLMKPESDFEEELLVAGKQPGEASRKMYDAHERQRLRKLYMCRRAREEIIQEEGGNERTASIDHAQLLFQGMNKPPERTIRPTANGIDSSKVIIPKSGQANSNLRPGTSVHSPTHPSTRSSSSKTSTTSSSKTSTPTSSTTKTSSSKTGTTSTSSSSTWSGRRHTADGPPRFAKRSASMPPTSRVRPHSAASVACRTPLSERIKMDLERPTRPLPRPYSASNLSERDQRILECMVFKREQEREEIKHQQLLRQVWQEEKERDEKIRVENELQRRRNLVEKEQDRQKKRDRMHKQREKEEKKKLKEAEISIKYKDEKHKHLASQQDLLKINQIESRKQVEKNKKEKQEKLYKEKEAKDEEYRRQVEKHISLSLDVAEAKRLQKQHHEELQKRNRSVMKQHAERKKGIDKKTEQENESKRLNIDIKDIIHKDLIEKQQLQRQSELRNSRRKMEQQQKKTSKAKSEIDGKLEKWRDDLNKHRSVVQEHAAVKAEKVVQEKAQKAQDLRIVKEKTHKERITRVAEDVEKMARYTEEKIKQKDKKVEEVKSKKQQEIDRSRAIAQNSAKLREQIRQQYTRTFDQMAHRAEIESRLGAGPQIGTKNYSHEYILS